MRFVPFVVATFLFTQLPLTALAALTGSPLAIERVAAFEASDHEWIEIRNTSDAPVDLTGWKFWEDGVNHGITSFVGGGILDPGRGAVIADRADFFVIDHPDYAGNIFDSSWSTLTLTGEPIGLRDPSGILSEFPEQLWMAEAPAILFPASEPEMLEPPSEPPVVEPLPPEITPTSTIELPPLEMTEPPQPDPITESIPTEPAIIIDPVPTPESTTATSSPTDVLPPSQEIVEQPTQPITDEQLPSPETSTSTTEVAPEVTPTTTNIPTSEEPTNTPEAEAPTTTPPPDPHVLQLSEAMPAPIEGSEWVEISNPTADAIPLDGLKLHDSVGSIATLTGTVPGYGYLTITLTSARLNNTGDTIRLVDALGQAIDEVRYGDDDLPAPSKGAVIARDIDGWHVSDEQTPGSANMISSPAEEEPDEIPQEPADPEDAPIPTPTIVPTPPVLPAPAKAAKQVPPIIRTVLPAAAKKTTVKVAAATKPAAPKKTVAKTTTAKKTSTAKTPAPRTITLADIRMVADNTVVVTDVTIVGASNPSLKQWFVVDGAAGAELIFSDRPQAFVAGDRVRITGKVDWTSGPVIRTSGTPIKLGSATTTAAQVNIDALTAWDGHKLIQLTGTVASVRGQRLTLADHGAQLSVLFPGAPPAFAVGSVIKVTGVYRADATPELVLTQADDVALLAPAPEKPGPATAASSRRSPWPAAIAWGILAIVLGRAAHEKWLAYRLAKQARARDTPKPVMGEQTSNIAS